MVLAIASGAAVAAKDQMHSRFTSLPARTKRCSLAKAPRSAHLPSHVGATRVAGASLCRSKRCFQPVSEAAATRKALPAFTAGSGGGMITTSSSSSRWRFSGRAFLRSPLGHQLCSQPAVLPNPSGGTSLRSQYLCSFGGVEA